MVSAANSTLSVCIQSVLSRSVFTAWFSVYLLFLPLFFFILYIGFNKWKKRQSSASGGLSHSDAITLHMVAMEIISVIGLCFSLYGFFSSTEKMLFVSVSFFTLTISGQVLFHSLTCVERYLAVVRPVTYLRLRGEGGVTVRNISIALVWIVSVTFCVTLSLRENVESNQVYGLVLILLATPLVTYCSVCVLCVLIRPKPGAGNNTKQIDQSKRASVCTMITILGVLLMRLLSAVIYYCVVFTNIYTVDVCLVGVVSNWFGFPSSLVLPLLFLYRTGKLPGKVRK